MRAFYFRNAVDIASCPAMMTAGAAWKSAATHSAEDYSGRSMTR
jgi:hypothetical protein